MNLKSNIEEFNLVFLDLETTGLDAVRGDAICEIGALKVKERNVVDKFETLVNPKRAIPEEAFRIHKISDADVKDAPIFEAVADKLVSFMKDSIVLAYNAEFDLGFVNHELKKANKGTLEVPAIDILCMARKTVKLARYNLGAISSFFNIEYTGDMHRALGDAQVASGVFFKLRDMLKDHRLNSLEDFVSLYGLQNEIFKTKEEPKVYLVRKAIDNKSFLRVRSFSYQNTMDEEAIKPLGLTRENDSFFLAYENRHGKNIRINLNRILDVEIV